MSTSDSNTSGTSSSNTEKWYIRWMYGHTIYPIKDTTVDELVSDIKNAILAHRQLSEHHNLITRIASKMETDSDGRELMAPVIVQCSIDIPQYNGGFHVMIETNSFETLIKAIPHYLKDDTRSAPATIALIYNERSTFIRREKEAEEKRKMEETSQKNYTIVCTIL